MQMERWQSAFLIAFSEPEFIPAMNCYRYMRFASMVLHLQLDKMA